MAVPKRKTTPSRRGNRRAHDALTTPGAIVESPDTGELKLRHHIDKDGFYRGRQVIKQKQAATEESSES